MGAYHSQSEDVRPPASENDGSHAAGLQVVHQEVYSSENQARRIAMLNEIFGNVELSEAEMRTLIWLAGWAENTVENVVSAIRKAMAADAKRRELPPRP